MRNDDLDVNLKIMALRYPYHDKPMLTNCCR
eukprot:COSAG05_NODE_9792_length_601_cov_0.922311_2_plen_30_part_01